MMVSPSKEKPLWYANVPALFQDWKALNTDAPIGQPQKRLQINVPLLRALLWTPLPVNPLQILFSLPLFLHSFASCKVSLPWDFTRDYPGPLFRDRSPCKIPFRSVTDEGETNSTFFIFLRPAVSLFRESLLIEMRTLHLSLLTCESDLANPFFLLLNAISISHRIVYNARFYFVALCRTFF